MSDHSYSILKQAPDVVVEFDDEMFDCACEVHVTRDAGEDTIVIDGGGEMFGALALPLIKLRPRLVTERQAFVLVAETLEDLLRDVIQSHFAALGDLSEGREEEYVADLGFNHIAVELLIKNLSSFKAYDRAKQAIETEYLVIAEMNKREMDEGEPLDVTSLGATLLDGAERNRENPETFEVPDKSDINAIATGDFVKVGLEGGAEFGGGERFWCEVADISGKGKATRFTLRVMDELICYPTVPLGKKLVVEPRHILSVV